MVDRTGTGVLRRKSLGWEVAQQDGMDSKRDTRGESSGPVEGELGEGLRRVQRAAGVEEGQGQGRVAVAGRREL